MYKKEVTHIAQGTSAGAVFLDLVVRDTIAGQAAALAQKAAGALQKGFSGAGAHAGKVLADSLTAPMERAGRAASGALQSALDGGYNKALERAKARAAALEEQFEGLGARLDAMRARAKGLFDSAPNPSGAAMQFLEQDKAFQALAQKQEAVLQRLRQAEEALRIEQEAAAAQAAAAKIRAAERAAQAEEGAAQKAAAAQEKAAEKSKRKWAAFAKSLLARPKQALAALGKSLLGVSRHAAKGAAGMQSFGARLRGIVSGALIFNGLSSALRGMTSRLAEAVTGTAQMKTALSRLQGAASVAAAPLLSALTPALSAIANAAATAFSYLARLISLLTGQSLGAMRSAAKGMAGYGASAGGAAKQVNELAKASHSLGLDELNVIEPPDGQDGGAGGGGGGGAESIAPDFSFEGKSPFLDSVLNAIQNGDYTRVGTLFAEKLNGVVASIDWAPIDRALTRWASRLADGLNGFVDALDWAALGDRIAGGFNTAFHAVDAFFQRFDWRALGGGLAKGLGGAVAALDAAALGRVLTDKLRAAVEALYGFVTTFDWSMLGAKLAQLIDAALCNVDWGVAAQGISGLVTGLLDTLLAAVGQTDWGQIGAGIIDLLCGVDWLGLIARLGLVILEAAGGLLELIGGFFEGLAAHCGEGFFGGLLDAFAGVFLWLKEHMVDPLVNGIKELLGIHSPSTVFAELGAFLVEGLFGGLSGTWGKITEFFGTALGAIIAKVTAAWGQIQTSTQTVWRTISGFVGGVWDGIRAKCGAVWDSVKEKTLGAWTGLHNGMKGVVNRIIRVMNGLLSGAADMVNRIIDVLNGLSIDVPKWAQGAVGTDHFGFHIPPVSAPQIPLLAQGGYVGPNQPRLAVIGDNRREGEIVAPESKLAEAVAAGMSGRGAGNLEVIDLLTQILEGVLRAADKESRVELDGDVLARSVQNWQEGRGAAIGGSFAHVY